MVATQRLLIPGYADGSLTASFLEEEQISFPQAILADLIKGHDPRGPVLELRGEDCFCPIDEEEGRFTGRLGRCCADRPYHGLELVKPAFAAGCELFLEASCLEALEDLRVITLGLAVASWMRHRGIADLCADARAVGLEEATGELRAVVSDDAVGDAKAAHQALDELDS